MDNLTDKLLGLVHLAKMYHRITDHGSLDRYKGALELYAVLTNNSIENIEDQVARWINFIEGPDENIFAGSE